MKQPKISYLVSTYKSEAFMVRHLDDLLSGQTDPDFEIIVIDSDSPERDGEIAQEYAARDDRVKYIKQLERTNYGVSWLKGWEQAKGEYVSNSNTDDLHHPEFTADVSTVMSRFDGSQPPRAFAYSWLNVMDTNGRLIGRANKPSFDYGQYSYECHGGPQLTWRNDTKFRNQVNWDFLYKRASQYKSAFVYLLILYFMSFE